MDSNPQHTPISHTRPRAGLVIAVALAAFAVKAYCVLTTFGSGDVSVIYHFAQVIDANGMDYLYRTDRLFNHPPLAGSFFWWIYHVSTAISPKGVCGVPTALPILLRIPSIVADLLSVLILLRIREKTGRPSAGALILFAASPVAFMVSAFHGNTDSIMVCLLLAAAWFCIEEHPAACGIFLALSCNVKIIPLLLTPVFFFFWLHRGPRKALAFSAAFGLFCLAGWSAALIGSPVQFFKNVLGYPSWAGAWGVTYWYAWLADHFHLAPRGRSPFESIPWMLASLKLAIICAILFIGWTRRKRSGQGIMASLTDAWICFMILAPGFIPYYLVWLAPFLVCYSTPWYVAITAASSAYLFAYYNTMSHGMPWNVADLGAPPSWPVWGNLPWFALIAMAAVTLWNRRRKNMETPEPGMCPQRAAMQPVT